MTYQTISLKTLLPHWRVVSANNKDSKIAFVGNGNAESSAYFFIIILYFFLTSFMQIKFFE